MKTKVFTGKYIPNGVVRQVQITDPSTGKAIKTNERFDIVEGLVLSRVSGTDPFKNTGEESVTIWGQYLPGKTFRICASSQNKALAVAALTKGNVEKGEDGRMYLIVEHKVTAIGTKMPNYGILLTELYRENADGSKTCIIAAPKSQVEKELDEELLEETVQA